MQSIPCLGVLSTRLRPQSDRVSMTFLVLMREAKLIAHRTMFSVVK